MPRSMRTWPGSVCAGRDPSAGSLTILPIIARLLEPEGERARLSLLLLAQGDWPRRLREAEARDAPWPRDPDGDAALSGHLPTLVRGGGGAAHRERSEPHTWRLDMARRSRGCCRSLSSLSAGESRRRDECVAGRSRPLGRHGHRPAARSRRAITSPWWSTMPCRGSPMWCADRISKRRPTCTCFCRHCSACRRHFYHHHPLIRDRRGRQAGEKPVLLRDPCESSGKQAFRPRIHPPASGSVRLRSGTDQRAIDISERLAEPSTQSQTRSMPSASMVESATALDARAHPRRSARRTDRR